MKLVAVSRVRNEVDIIEAFVRHHAVYFGKIIVLDDGSNDGTYEALQSLQVDGLPLVVLRTPVIGYEQSRYMTRLLQIAVDQFGADWVAPLDADEFIELEDGATLAETLSGQENRLLSIAWENFEWRPEYDDSAEPNPILRQRLRGPSRPDLNKLLVPASLVDATTQLQQGNHFLIKDGRQLAARPVQAIRLGHFPIRSVHQYASKIAIGYLQYLAMPNWDRNLGFQYIEPFQDLLAGGLEALKSRMSRDSRQYSIINGSDQEPTAVSRDKPLRYQGGPLRLAHSRSSFLQNILHHAEALARDRANGLRRVRLDSIDDETESREAAVASAARPFLIAAELADEDPSLTPVDRLKKLQHQLSMTRSELDRRSVDKDALEMRLAKTEIQFLDAQQQIFALANARTLKSRIRRWLARAGLSPSTINRLGSFWRRRRPLF